MHNKKELKVDEILSSVSRLPNQDPVSSELLKNTQKVTYLLWKDENWGGFYLGS